MAEPTLRRYRQALGRFKEYAAQARLLLSGDGSVDAAHAQLFTAEYFRERARREASGLLLG